MNVEDSSSEFELDSDSYSDTSRTKLATGARAHFLSLIIGDHPRMNEAVKLVKMLTAPQCCQTCNDGGHSLDEGIKSLSNMVRHYRNHPIPKPDFCERADKAPLTSSCPENRAEVLKNIEARLTGITPTEEGEDGEEGGDGEDGDGIPKFDLRRDGIDLDGSVTLDIDSAVGLAFPLSMINSVIHLDLIPSRGRNMTSSSHINLQRIPVHRLPHFRLGTFGRVAQFELYMILPGLRSRVKGTHVPEAILKAWVNEVLIPAAECIPDQCRIQWSSNWDQEVAKLSAKREGKRTKGVENQEDEAPDDGDMKERQRLWDSRLMESSQKIAPEFIQDFWNAITKLLDEAIAKNHKHLEWFRGYQLFCCSKNLKTIIFERSASLPNLLEKMRRTVP